MVSAHEKGITTIMALPTYQEHEIFEIPWVSVSVGSVFLYESLRLDKVALEYRIQLVSKGYRIRCKQGQEAPWTLGICLSLEEARYRVYDSILYFQLFIDGTWDGMRTHRPLSPADKAAQWSLEGRA